MPFSCRCFRLLFLPILLFAFIIFADKEAAPIDYFAFDDFHCRHLMPFHWLSADLSHFRCLSLLMPPLSIAISLRRLPCAFISRRCRCWYFRHVFFHYFRHAAYYAITGLFSPLYSLLLVFTFSTLPDVDATLMLSCHIIHYFFAAAAFRHVIISSDYFLAIFSPRLHWLFLLSSEFFHTLLPMSLPLLMLLFSLLSFRQMFSFIIVFALSFDITLFIIAVIFLPLFFDAFFLSFADYFWLFPLLLSSFLLSYYLLSFRFLIFHYYYYYYFDIDYFHFIFFDAYYFFQAIFSFIVLLISFSHAIIDCCRWHVAAHAMMFMLYFHFFFIIWCCHVSLFDYYWCLPFSCWYFAIDWHYFHYADARMPHIDAWLRFASSSFDASPLFSSLWFSSSLPPLAFSMPVCHCCWYWCCWYVSPTLLLILLLSWCHIDADVDCLLFRWCAIILSLMPLAFIYAAADYFLFFDYYFRFISFSPFFAADAITPDAVFFISFDAAIIFLSD